VYFSPPPSDELDEMLVVSELNDLDDNERIESIGRVRDLVSASDQPRLNPGRREGVSWSWSCNQILCNNDKSRDNDNSGVVVQQSCTKLATCLNTAEDVGTTCPATCVMTLASTHAVAAKSRECLFSTIVSNSAITCMLGVAIRGSNKPA